MKTKTFGLSLLMAAWFATSQWRAVAATGPNLWLKFDETTGSVATDSSGNGNNAVFTTDPVWAAGQVGNAATFSGAYGDTPNCHGIDVSGTNITIAAWMSTVAGSDAVVIDKPANPADVANNTFSNPFYQYGIERNGRTLGFYFADENSTVRNVSSPEFIKDDTWFHFAVTYDGATVRWYYNGVLTNSASATGRMQAKGTRLRLGADDRPQQLFQQSLDDLRIYSQTLGAADIGVLAGNTNLAPLVSLTEPRDGAAFPAGAYVTITADASTSGGAIQLALLFKHH